MNKIKYTKPLMIVLLLLSFYGLYLISKGSFKYSQSLGYGIVGISVFGINTLKRKELKESN
jgi:hypothetical protein